MNDIPDKWVNQLPQWQYTERLEKQVKDQNNKISELELRVEHLKVSRRVLMNLLEKVEQEKVAAEYLSKRRKKINRPRNPFKIAVDNSKTFYLRSDLFDTDDYKEERELTLNPESIFKELAIEESK